MVFGHPNVIGYAAGLLLVAIGQALRIWAAGHLVKTLDLTVSGPFAWVRNPLYIGSLIIACGYCTMFSGWLVWLVVIPLFFTIHSSAVIWEERFLRSQFGATFEDYCARVPRWIPRRPAQGAAARGRVSIRQLKINKEHRGLIGTSIVVLAYLIKLLAG